MKALIKSVIVAAATLAIAVPFAASAQSTAPVTRASVRADLVRIEAAGYNPADSDQNYPMDVQAAQARVLHSAGGVQSGSSDAGGATSASAYTVSSPYVGH